MLVVCFVFVLSFRPWKFCSSAKIFDPAVSMSGQHRTKPAAKTADSCHELSSKEAIPYQPLKLGQETVKSGNLKFHCPPPQKKESHITVIGKHLKHTGISLCEIFSLKFIRRHAASLYKILVGKRQV